MLPQNKMSKFQAFVYFNIGIWIIHLITLLTVVGYFIKDNSMYNDIPYRQTYLASLIMRFIWMVPILLVLNSLKNYYGILVNKGCCDSSIETVMLSYILLNMIPYICLDAFCLADRLYDFDIDIYKVEGPLTICLMLGPLVVGIIVIICVMYIDKCMRCYWKNEYQPINDDY